MANFVHLRRVHVSSRLTKSRRNFNAAATDFRTQQHLLVKSHVLNADYAVKALGQGLKPEGQSAKRTAGGVTAEKKPEIRFDPKATKKPGQVFKMNITGADMLRDGDEPNWGWVDPPKPVTDEDRNETYQKFARRPKIRIREFDVDPRTGGPRFDTGVQVKALGDKIGGGAASLGGRAASSMGLIVDALGKFRCPPGTPAANQFTDEFGSNCFSPLAVLRSGIQSLTDLLRKPHLSDGGVNPKWLRSQPIDVQRRHAGVQAATSSIRTSFQLGQRQAEIVAGVEDLKEELGIDLSEGRKLKNLDLYEVFDKLKEAGWEGSWKDRVTDIYGTAIVPRDGETTEEFVERIDGVLTENFLSLAEALELGHGYGRHGTVSDEFRARYESGEEGIVTAIAIMREKRYANHRGAMESFVTMYKEDPSKFDNFTGFGTRLFADPSTNAMAEPDVRPNAKPGDTIVLLNDLAGIANEYWQFRGDKISQVMVEGMHTEAEKMEHIREFLKIQKETAPWLVGYSEFHAMDVASASAWDTETQTLAEGIRAAHRARGMQLGFHEFTHVEQNALVQRRVVDRALAGEEIWIHGVPAIGIPAKDKPLLAHDPSDKNYLPNEPFSHWSNLDWADAIGSAMLDPESLGAIKDGDIPPRDIHEFEGSMLHHLAGGYYQSLVDQWHSGTLEPGSAEAQHLQLMLIEGTAELNAQRKMGLIGGDRIEEMLSYLDVKRDPIPRYRNPTDTQGVLDGADETPGMPGIEPMPLEDPTGSWDRLSKRIESMHKRGVGPRGDAREMRSLIHNEFDYTDEALYNIGADVMDSRYVELSAEVDALYDKYLDGGLNKDEQARLFLASRGMEQIINENARRIRASDEQRAERLFLGKEVNPGKHVPDTMPPYVMEDLDLDAHDPVDTSVFGHRDIVEEIYPKLGSEDNLTPAARAIMPPSMSETEATLSTHTATRREVVDGGLTDVQQAAVSADLETKHGDVFLNPDELGQAIRQSAAAKRYADDHGIPLEDPSPDTPSPHIDREIDQVIAPAMRAIDDNPLTDPITVRTTLSGEELAEFTSMEVGQVVSANTFTTGVVASHDQNDMADGLPGSGTIRIEMPEGTKALFKDHPTDGSNNGVLLPPGDFKIKSIEDGGDIVLELVSQKTTDDVLSDIEGVLDDLPAPASRAEGRERRNLRNVLTKNREEARLESEKITEPAFEYDNPIDTPYNLVVEEYNALKERHDMELASPTAVAEAAGRGVTPLTENEESRLDDLARFIRLNETGSVDIPDPDSDFVTADRGLASRGAAPSNRIDTIEEYNEKREGVMAAAQQAMDAAVAAGADPDEARERYQKTVKGLLGLDEKNPIKTSNPDVAMQILLDGGDLGGQAWLFVELDSERQYRTLMKNFKQELKNLRLDRESKLKLDSEFDMCKVTVPGTSLFCTKHTGRLRSKMPQLAAKNPAEGSEAWRQLQPLRKEAYDKAIAAGKSVAEATEIMDGVEIDMTDSWLQSLQKRGIRVFGTRENPLKWKASNLTATQENLDGAKVTSMMLAAQADAKKAYEEAIEAGKTVAEAEVIRDAINDQMIQDVKKIPGFLTKPIVVTRDGYVIDGHHRWAALVALDILESDAEFDVDMSVIVVDMDINDAMASAGTFTDAMGMYKKDAADNLQDRIFPEGHMRAGEKITAEDELDNPFADYLEQVHETILAKYTPTPEDAEYRITANSHVAVTERDTARSAAKSDQDKVAAWNEARATSGIRDVSRERATRVREVTKELAGYQEQLRGKTFARQTAEARGDTEKVAELKKEFNHIASQERHFRDELRGLKSTGLKSSRRSADPSRRATMQNKVNERTAVRKQHGVGGKTGDIFDHDDGYVEEARALVETQFQLGPLVSGDNHHNWLIDTRENKVRRAREAASGGITRLREGRVLSESHLRSDDLLESIGHARRGDVPVPPAVAKFLAESTDEEVMAKLDEAVQTFVSDFDPRIRVAARPERIDEIFADSDRRYKTTHEVRSAHSTAGSRRTLEQMWGIPYDAPSEVRPASGYLEHKQFRQQKAAWIAARQKREPHRLRFGQTDPDFLPEYTGTLTPSGILGLVYGGDHAGGSISFVLRADRANDSGMIFGDSALQGAKRPTKITSTNSDDLLAAILYPEEMVGSHAERNAQENRLQIMSFLNGLLTSDANGENGDWSGATDPGVHLVAQADGISAMEKADTADRYVEALVPGGFDLDEVDHVSFPVSMLDTRNRDLTDVDIGRNHPDVQEALSAYNLSDTELDQLFSEIRDLLPGRSTLYMKEHLAASEKRAELKKVGLDTIFQNDDAIDIFDPKAWLSLPPNVWGDKPPSADSNVYELLQHLIRVSIIKHASRMVQKQRKPTRVSERVLTGSVV